MANRKVSLISLLLLALAPVGNVAVAALPTLARGVNLSHWLTYQGRQPIVQADMNLIREAGFDHVRIPFDPGFLGWQPDARGGQSAVLPQIGKLDAAVELAIQSGLVAILDFHPAESLKKRIETEPKIQAAFVNLWGNLATRYRNRPVEKLVYEVLNEPQYWELGSPADWLSLRGKALGAIRKRDSAHLVLLSGRFGGGIKGLLEEPTVKDPAVAYTFHYYEPMLFTHLGAPWEPFISGVQGMFTGLLYPASANSWSVVHWGNIQLKPDADEDTVAAAMTEYQPWGAARIAEDLVQVQHWSAEHRARVICDEFGVLQPGLDAVSRSRWLKDVRMTLEHMGLGWSVWDYADLFGIAFPTGDSYPTGDGAMIPVDNTHPSRQFRASDIDALMKP